MKRYGWTNAWALCVWVHISLFAYEDYTWEYQHKKNNLQIFFSTSFVVVSTAFSRNIDPSYVKNRNFIIFTGEWYKLTVIALHQICDIHCQFRPKFQAKRSKTKFTPVSVSLNRFPVKFECEVKILYIGGVDMFL